MYQALHRGWGSPFGIQNQEGEILAATFIFYSHGRLFPLFQLATAKGQAKGAIARLWDDVLRGHAGRPLRCKREEVLGSFSA
ncbi:MAG: hypothetical protein HC821_05895 [Lewinella sp.]|nr:hypothetical protein [Lewinella sp.]